METFKIGVLLFYHPLRAFAVVKRKRDQFRPIQPLTLITLAVLIKIITIYATNFTAAHIRPQDANIFFEVGIILLPFLAWVLCSHAILSIMSGETKLTENLTASSYCLIPYIIITPFLTLISHLVSTDEVIMLKTLETIVLLWMLILLFMSLKTLNDIRLGKALFITLLSIILMLILAAAVMLVIALISQVIYFVIEFTREIRAL